MNSSLWHTDFGEGPLVATAIHEGSYVRPEVAPLLKIDAARRRYEEDPFTAAWTAIASTRIVGNVSRFEFDLNRPRDRAVYLSPADAWGLDVWKSPPPVEVVERSRRAYDDFYAHFGLVLERLLRRHPRVVVFDFHSYNHGREGAQSSLADPELNPEINLGTKSLDRTLWSPVVDRWLAEMRGYDYFGRPLDVRENVKFFGGEMARWTHQQFPGRVGVLAIEVRKFFMNEWTGQVDEVQLHRLREAFQRAAAGVGRILENWGDATTDL